MPTTSLGFEFVETLKAKRKIEKVSNDPEKLSKIRKILQDEKERLEVELGGIKSKLFHIKMANRKNQ